MRSLHLLVPALFWPDSGAPQTGNDVRLPALETLFARGFVEREPEPGIDRWLAGHFALDLEQELPFAAIALAGSGAMPGDRFWLRADPVHLQPQSTELFMTRGADLAIHADEAIAMIGALNHYFAPEGLRFEAHGPHSWYLPLDDAAAMRTTPLELAHGRSIDALLPAGADARAWLKRVNEAQMLLHDLPANDAREARGVPIINSLWLWGGGRSPGTVAHREGSVVCADALTRGLGMLSGARVDTPPDRAAALFAGDRKDDALVRLDHGADAAARGDAASWTMALGALDADWIAPALTALARGRLGCLKLTGYAGRHGLTVSAGPGAMLKFWRRPAPLSRRRPPS